MRKTHSMFYAYLQCSVASVLPRGMGLSPGFYFIFYFFGSLEREPSLWENTWPWEILRTWESFPGIRLGNQDLWGGEKESTFDTGRRVETGTYHWEGRKPFIQTFELPIWTMFDSLQLWPWLSVLTGYKNMINGITKTFYKWGDCYYLELVKGHSCEHLLNMFLLNGNPRFWVIYRECYFVFRGFLNQI